MVLFVLISAAACVTYFVQGLFTRDVLVLIVPLGVPFLLALWAGARFFRSASDVVYRWIAYGIVALAALVSLPLFDGIFR